MAAAERLVFPVGQYGGAIVGDEPDTVRYTIRRGSLLWSLSAAPAAIWIAAHGLADGAGITPWTRAAVFAQAADTLPSPQAETAYGELLVLRLITEVDPDAPEAVDFARAHRLLPRAHGLGNTPGNPGRFRVGFPPDLVASLPWNLWRLWRDSHLEPSLWDACVTRSAQEERAGRSADPHILLANMLDTLHILLAIRVAYLDWARTEEETAGVE
jgi:hypothetical protein